MNELELGDRPVIQYNQNYFGVNNRFDIEIPLHKNSKLINIPKDLSENLDFCYLLGLFVAEGNFTNAGITITNVDGQISNFLINDGAKLGKSFTKYNEKHHHFASAELIKWFDVDMKYAKDIVEIWYSKLPVVISLRSSTNPAVLVTETTTVNSTL